MKNMKRQTAVRQSFFCSAPLFIALFSMLFPGRLIALDLDLMLRGKWPPFPRGPAVSVAIQNSYAFVVMGDAGLTIIDVSNPANPQRVGGYDTSGTAWGVAVLGNYAYVADDTAGLQVIDVSNPANPRRVGGNPLFAASDLIVAANKVFVAAGGQDGLVILDLFRALRLEPVSPQQLGSFRLLVHGQAGLSVRVQRSANLRDWEDWQALTLGATPSELSDLDAGAVSHRFYRGVTP
jgi:hypothetical protein